MELLYKLSCMFYTNDIFTEEDEDYLGHVSLWDPVMSCLNLIRALRVGLYHDELHIEQIEDVLKN